MPELLDARDWARRKMIVDDHNANGGHLSYWDHLPTDEGTPPFDHKIIFYINYVRSYSEIKEQAYAADFNRIYETYLEQIHVFILSMYPSDVRDIQLCAVLIYWNMVTTLEAVHYTYIRVRLDPAV